MNLNDTIIDIRDIIERFEELEDAADGLPDAEERFILASILDELRGNGGDEQWRGDWYPLTLIRADYFTSYIWETLEDCGSIPNDLPWFVVVDREATANNCKVDYSTIEIDGQTFYYR